MILGVDKGIKLYNIAGLFNLSISSWMAFVSGRSLFHLSCYKDCVDFFVAFFSYHNISGYLSNSGSLCHLFFFLPFVIFANGSSGSLLF